MQRAWFALSALSLAALLFLLHGCAYLQANAERHDYNTVLYSIERLPQSVKDKCGFDVDSVPDPSFIADKRLDDDPTKDGFLDRRLVIHYNPWSETAIFHETQHYLNRVAGPNAGRVSWECLDELTAYYHAKWLACRNRSNRLEREARHARAVAKGFR